MIITITITCAALTWLAIITLAIYGISLYGAHLAKLRDQRKADGVTGSIEA